MSLDDLEEALQKLPEEKAWKEKLTQMSDTVSALNGFAQKLGERFRMHGPVYALDEEPKDIIGILTKPVRQVRVTRTKDDIWGIYVTETPTLRNFIRRETKGLWPISGCRVEVKLLFLKHSRDFFTKYLEHVREAFENMPKEIAQAGALIRELQELFKEFLTADPS